MGEHRDAILLANRSIILNPSVATSYGGRADAFGGLFNTDQAIIDYNRALSINPEFLEALVNIGLIYLSKNKFDESIRWLKTAIILRPNFAESINNLGNTMQFAGKFAQAIKNYRRYLTLNPNSMIAHHNLGTALADAGDIEGSVLEIQEAIRIQPDHADKIGAALVFGNLYRSGVSLKNFYDSSVEWGLDFVKRNPIHAQAPNIQKSSTIPTLGFMSGDFRSHAVGMLVLGALEGLKARGHKVFLYSSSNFFDKISERMAQLGEWRNIVGATDKEIADHIRLDNVDILIDLSGYTGHNRVEVLSHRAAPIQIFGWLGYPGTSGLPCADYMIGDRYQTPAEHDVYFTEKIIRMPDSYTCFVPPADAPDIPKRHVCDSITFGSFNVLKKISPDTIEVWSEILNKSPHAVMVIKAKGFDCEETTKIYQDMFAARGVTESRIKFLGASSQADHMRAMGDCDIVLDTFPYSGGQTTLECLWMGAPVITLVGETWASRHSYSYLSTIGLGDFACKNKKEYVKRAVYLAENLVVVDKLRRDMRQRILESPLCDVDHFTKAFELAMIAIWRRHQDNLSPESITL